jgi:hypothetical protein
LYIFCETEVKSKRAWCTQGLGKVSGKKLKKIQGKPLKNCQLQMYYKVEENICAVLLILLICIHLCLRLSSQKATHYSLPNLHRIMSIYMSRDSAVGIATGYGVDD